MRGKRLQREALCFRDLLTPGNTDQRDARSCPVYSPGMHFLYSRMGPIRSHTDFELRSWQV